MSATTAASAAYIVAALLFILSLAGLAKHETAKAGNAYGMAGMVIALAATIGLAARGSSATGVALLAGAMVVGALLQLGSDDGLVLALALVATLVASINVFGGFAVTRRMLGMFTRGPSTGSAAR